MGFRDGHICGVQRWPHLWGSEVATFVGFRGGHIWWGSEVAHSMGVRLEGVHEICSKGLFKGGYN